MKAPETALELAQRLQGCVGHTHTCDAGKSPRKRRCRACAGRELAGALIDRLHALSLHVQRLERRVAWLLMDDDERDEAVRRAVDTGSFPTTILDAGDRRRGSTEE